MKKIFMMALLCAIAGSLKAQNTYPFPSSGSVGIGTTTPAMQLNVQTAGGDLSGSTVTYPTQTTGILLDLSTGINNVGSGVWFDHGGLKAGIASARVVTTNWGTDLRFYVHPDATTNQNVMNEAMRINSSGNLGIGTTTPGNKLEVAGSAIFNPTNSGGNFTQGIRINNSNDNYSLVHLGGTTGITNNTGPGQWDLIKDYYNNFGIWENANPMLSILNTSGNVGVSTTDPISNFQVQDGCTKASIGEADGQDLNYGTSYLGFNAARNTSRIWTMSNDTHHNGGGVIYSNIEGNIYFAPIPSTTGASDQTLSDLDIKSRITFRIANDGITYAKQIKVELTGWPDYVFKPSYTLRSLSEVKTYIDENHHLPDMPSAAEVEKDGLNLGEMNKVLTKKVEELTLYLIEKDKNEKDQQRALNLQKQQLNLQETQLKNMMVQLKELADKSEPKK